MCMILKRDGREVKFDKNKISMAICEAYKNTKDISVDVSEYKPIADKIANSISILADGIDKLSVEKIQDAVEDRLMDENKHVAKQYIIYRNDRSRIREKNSPIMRTVGEKLRADNVQNQNANVDEHSFGGRLGEAKNEVVKRYALLNCMSELSRKNHENNMIYIHDLDSYAVGEHNCLSIPFDDLLANGFNVRQTDVRPAASVNTAFQLVAVIFQVQSLQQFGGVAATHLDWTMVPYVKKSFFKHYISAMIKDTEEFYNLDLMDMMFGEYEDEVGIIRDKFDDWLDNTKEELVEKFGIVEDLVCMSNEKNLDKKYYQCALFDTIKETKQAAEALFHNLNSLQSRSGK